MSTPSSPLPLALFAAKRMLRNAGRKKLGRMREPRYLVGFLIGAAYFAMLFLRPGRAGRPPAPPRLPGHMNEILLLAGAAALAAAALLTWLFRKGQPSLGLSEAEIQFLFPAPVARRALLHYALLKAQLPVLLSAFILTAVSGRRGLGAAILSGTGLWLLLTAVHFHNLALAFTKARWNELPAASRRLTKTAVFALSGGALGVLAVTFGAGFRAAASGPGGGLSLGGLVFALRSGPFGPAPLALLAPFRWILAPLLAPTARAFSAALPPALGVLCVLYACVALTAVRFEEATLSQASRRAALRARRDAGRLEALPSEKRRGTAPFALAPWGRPEVAIVWKNLLAWNRTSLRQQAAIVAFLAAALFSASALLATPSADAAAAVGSAACLALTALLALITPLGFRIDLRGDLEYATVLRTWPLRAERLVLAELGAPAAVAVLYGWGGIAIALAIAAGRVVRAGLPGAAVAPPPAVANILRFEALVPVALTVAVFLPALVVATLVVQNASVLAFPAWFPAGRKRAVGLEQMGLRMLSFFGTSLVLGLALIPAALLAGPLIFFAYKPLGLWCLPLAALLAALPLLAEAAGGVFLLARLLERFDPSRDGGS